MISRRGFLGAVSSTVLASAVPWPMGLPLPGDPQGIFIDPQAFARCSEIGISIRLIRHFNPHGITRVDVLAGYGTPIARYARRA